MSSKAPRRFIIFVLSSPEQQRCYKSAGQRVGDKRESGREKGGASRRTKGLSDKSGARWMPKSVPVAADPKARQTSLPQETVNCRPMNAQMLRQFLDGVDFVV